MRGRLGNLGGALAVAASLAAAGCGDGDSSDLASLVPPDAPLYVEAVLRPEDEQAEAVESFADRVGGIEDPGGAIIAELDASLAADGVKATYADIEAWLGSRGALFVRSFETDQPAGEMADVAVAVETEDPDAARSFVDDAEAADPEPEEARSYGDFDYSYSADEDTATGLIYDFLVTGTEDAFKVAVDASQGHSLAESDEYMQRTEALGDDLLGSAYLEPGATVEAAIASEGIDPETAKMLKPLIAGPLSDPVAIGLSATPDAASVDFVSMVDGQEDIATDASLIEGLPAGSWLAVGVPDLGGALRRTLDQLANSGLPGGRSIEATVRDATGIDLGADPVGWLGDAAAFVEGTAQPEFSAGVVAETTDAQGPRELLERAQALAERESGLRSSAPPEGAEYGFSLGLPGGLGGGAEAGVIGDRLVAVIGGTVNEALDPEAKLGDDPRYQDAVESLGDEFPAGLYLHLPSFFEVAEQGGSATDPDYQAAIPYLEAFEALVAGTRIDDELAITRLAVSLAE